MADHYEISEKDIDSVLKFLELTDPEHAMPEMAIEILETMQASVHELAHDDPELLVKIYEQVKNNKKPD